MKMHGTSPKWRSLKLLCDWENNQISVKIFKWKKQTLNKWMNRSTLHFFQILQFQQTWKQMIQHLDWNFTFQIKNQHSFKTLRIFPFLITLCLPRLHPHPHLQTHSTLKLSKSVSFLLTINVQQQQQQHQPHQQINLTKKRIVLPQFHLIFTLRFLFFKQFHVNSKVLHNPNLHSQRHCDVLLSICKDFLKFWFVYWNENNFWIRKLS